MDRRFLPASDFDPTLGFHDSGQVRVRTHWLTVRPRVPESAIPVSSCAEG